MSTGSAKQDEPAQVHFLTIWCYRKLPFFWSEPMRRTVIDALRSLQQRFGICLIGYVVMPEHVHMLLYPHKRADSEPIPISSLARAFRKHIDLYGRQRLRDFWQRQGRLWSEPLNAWARGRLGTDAIWDKRGQDFVVGRRETLIEKLDHCHNNPVRRRLVKDPAEWRWSSYRFYEWDDKRVLTMDWDGQWPVAW